jgi:branched-chain amino acid transport system permease protein
MDLRERYDDDLVLVRSAGGRVALVAFLAALVAFPLRAPGYLVYSASLVAAHAVIAVGLSLLIGTAGLISLGHAGFVAIGAYTTGLLAAKVHVFWPVAVMAGGVIASAFGFLVGLPALRLTGPYLTIATLGFGISVNQVLANWEQLSGGRNGVFLPKLTLGAWQLTERHIYYVAVGTLVLLVWVAYNLLRSYVGRALVAMRDSDIAAEVMGVNLTRYKTLAFALSAFYAGIGGALLALILGFLEPQLFTLFESIFYFSMIVVGGLGTIPGAVLGAALLTLLPLQLAQTKAWLPIIYGGIIVFVMAVDPLGLYGRWIKIKLWFKGWPF